MRRRIYLVVLLSSLVMATTCPAPITDDDFLTIDFTNEKDARAKAEWAIQDGGEINEQGLGCDKKTCTDRWIETKPMPIGLSLRPTSGARITVKIVPPPRADAGEVFARYSPDGKHWSTWQALSRDEKETRVGVFKGDLSVPTREQQIYVRYRENFNKANPKSHNNEEAAVQWILQCEPNFFEHTLPFIGYVQFLFEAPAEDPWRIRNFEAEALWSVSGFGYPTSDLKTRWRFKAP